MKPNKLLISITVILLLLFSQIPTLIIPLVNAPPAGWWNSNLQYRKKITFNNSAISGNLLNYTVPIVFGSAQSDFWNHVQTNGNDTRFVDADNTTELYFEFEQFNHTGDNMIAWVRVPQIDASSTTDFIWVYYGNATANFDGYYKSSAAWDPSYQAVYHLNQTSGTLYDAAKGNNGTPTGCTYNTTGIIGKCLTFGGADKIGVGNPTGFDNVNITVETWFRTTHDFSARSGRIVTVGSGATNLWLLQVETGNKVMISNSSASHIARQSDSTVNDGNWHFAAGLRSPSETLYVDGTVQSGTRTADTYSFEANSTIASRGTDYYYYGDLDEVRISNTIRSANWIKADYQYQVNTSKFTFGSEESYSGPVGWQYFKRLYFDNSASAENLVNFPVLINLTRAGADFWSHVGSIVNDLKFVDSDNTTSLYFEVEYWNYTGHEGYAWVKVPQIDAGSTADFIYLYYGNPSPPSSPYLNSANVWDSNFMMVHHLEESSGTVTDSTSHGNNGTYHGTTQGVKGKIDAADEFNGVDNYIAINHSTSLNFGTGPFTISVWVKYNSNNVDSDILRKGCTTNTPPSPSNYKLELVSNALHGNLHDEITSDASVQTPLTYSDNTWHYVVFLREGTTIRLYVDASLKASDTGATHDLTNTANMSIGSKDTYDDDFYDGVIDEVQISNTTRSAAWITASYSSMNDTFVTFETAAGPIELTVTNPQNTTYSVTTVPLEGSTTLNANITYSLDSQANVSVANKTKTFSTSLPSLSYSSHSVTVYAVESVNASNTASKKIYFTVAQAGNWQYAKKVYFNNSASAEDLVDFPVLINLTRAGADFWSHVASSGNDLRFVDSDCVTDLYFEVEYWNYALNQSLVWVKVPQIDTGSTSDFIYVYYGNPNPPPTIYRNSAGVWNSNFRMVQHLNETSGTHYDATSNNNDGTISGSVNQNAAGAIDGADSFDGSSGYVNCGNGASLTLTEYTLEAWIKRVGIGTGTTTGTSGFEGDTIVPILTKGKAQTDTLGMNVNYFLGINITSNKVGFDFEDKEQPGLNHPIQSTTTIANNQWYYITVTYDGTTERIYINGILDNSLVVSKTPDSCTWAAAIGSSFADAGAAGFFNGTIDEARISLGARSPAWIKAQSLSMTDKYVTFGSQQAPNNPPAKPFNPSPQNDATGISTSPTLSVNVTDPEGNLMNVSFYQTGASGQAANNFTVIVLPDTQYYSSNTTYSDHSEIFDSQTQWAVNNAVGMNILFVTHEGDIIDGFSSSTQWDKANRSMSILNTGNLPWGAAPGNHDLNMDSDTSQFNIYFGTSRFTGKTWYGGCLGGDNANSYEFFNNGADQYLILHLQYNPSTAILAWANTTLTANPGKRVILVTHEYMSGSSRDSVGNTIWNSFVKYHTDQVFLVLCGHSLGEGLSTDTSTGHAVHQVLADYQGRTNGGNGWLRILDFRPAEDKIYVKTYSPYLNQYETDLDSQFTLDYDMTGTTPQPPTLIGKALNVLNGTKASVPWTGLNYSTTYYWYAVAEDINGGKTQSDTWNFTTNPLSLGWDVALTATKEGYNDIADFGVRGDATYGFDASYDQVKSPAPPTGVYSYFWYPNNPTSPVNLQKLSTSIVGPWPADRANWTYRVTPVGIDGTMNINWTAQAIAAIPASYTVQFCDANGIVLMNMRQATGYSFTAQADTEYTFVVKVGNFSEFTLNLSAGWNMVSFPVIPSNASFANIFTGVGYYQVLAWSGTSYVTPANATAGQGYWVLVLSTTKLNVTGVPVESYERDLPAGWSMIGGIYNATVNAASVFPSYYQLLTWSGTGYVSATTIEPGKGYWALVLVPTHIEV
jgi:hypothetical protein